MNNSNDVYTLETDDGHQYKIDLAKKKVYTDKGVELDVRRHDLTKQCNT